MATTYSQLIPFEELSVGQPGAIRNEVIRRLVAEAAARLSMPADRLIVRDIIPTTDISLYSAGTLVTVNEWTCVTGTGANQYEDFAQGTMTDQRWIGIYGVMVDAANFACTSLKFHIGGSDRVIWELQNLWSGDDLMVGFCPSGLIIPQNDPYTISRYVRSISSTTRIILKGITVEPRGKLVSP